MKQSPVNILIRKYLNGKRTINDAILKLQDNAIARERKFDDAELRFWHFLNDAIKLGYGSDTDFTRVYR